MRRQRRRRMTLEMAQATKGANQRHRGLSAARRRKD
jgi:hypothetical protein